MGKYVIGLDCSTTSVKAIVFDRKGRISAIAQEPLSLFSPQLNYYEQEANDWWNATRIALKKVCRHIEPDKILAIAISNQRETFVPLDKKGNCLRPAIVWLDERCKDEVELFAKSIGKNKIHKITGKPVDYAPVVYRLAWMKKNEPKLFRKIGMICDVHTYLTWKLTGLFKTSWASADPLGLFDIESKRWSVDILRKLELEETQLPVAFRPGTILGNISKQASKSTGLSVNTLVVAGGGDGQSAGVGVNVLTSECAYLNLGTAVVAGVYGKEYKISQAFRTMCSCSEDGYYYECSLRAGTFSIDWLVKKILKIDTYENPDIYRELENKAQNISIGSDGLIFLPYLCGVMNPYWDINARGAFIGLSSSHTREHIYRAILEGIAFEQLLAINSVEDAIRSRIKKFHVIGGGASSKLWLNILADVTGRDIFIQDTTEASGLGAAISAAVGVGWYKNFKEAAKNMSRIKKVIKPNMYNHKKYQEIFFTYEKIFPLLKKVWQ